MATQVTHHNPGKSPAGTHPFLFVLQEGTHPSGVAKLSTSFGWGKGWNVTSAGWQVTLCDPIYGT